MLGSGICSYRDVLGSGVYPSGDGYICIGRIVFSLFVFSSSLTCLAYGVATLRLVVQSSVNSSELQIEVCTSFSSTHFG